MSPVDVVYLDFQKAFDKVPHEKLLLKQKAHGIGNDVTNWTERWLTHRRQILIIEGDISNWKSVLSGVRHGSILCPILYFNIFLNDFEEDISSKVMKYSDDTKVFRKVTNDRDKHDQKKWQLLLNFLKCKCTNIGHGNKDDKYKMGDAVLGRTTQVKSLGVTFSADMKMSEQNGIAASKGNKIIGLIRRTLTYK